MKRKVSIDFRSKVNAVRLVLIFSVLIMGVKFFAYSLSKSNAILSDALESLINIATSGFTLYSIYYSSKLRDSDHPYGHGKIEYLAVGFEGALILCTGIYIIFIAITHFFQPVVLRDVDSGILLTALSGLAMYFIGTFLKRKGREMNSMPLIADGEHFHVDTVTSVGLIAGLLLFKLTGWYWIDPTLAIVLALHIMMSGYKLVKVSIDHLLDKADLATIQNVSEALQKYRHKSWIDIHNLRLQKFGQYLHVDCHITLPFYFTLEQVHDEVKLLEKELNRDFENAIEIFIHTDPCQQIPCAHCEQDDCVFRKSPFIRQIPWTPLNLMTNKKHQLETEYSSK
ncbi:cation diffusion facilitator family transporter [soil metagenome]